jgi:hypothetical protein
MIHVLLASALPLAIFFVSWWRRGRRTSARALVLLALGAMGSSAWAVVPDLPRLWGDLEYYVELHHRSYCNAWWLHCAIDARDDIDSSMLFPALFVLAAGAVLAVAWRELRLLEDERARGDRARDGGAPPGAR